MSLLNLAEGEKAIVIKTNGGYGLIRRLAEMGLTPGTEVKILRKCTFGGPVEIEVRGVALALGRGVASRILVKPLKADAHD
ncbi:ferrous iron transport protein A [Candidatus Bathyarchaeota archaeon]|nr:ferrous iron transport protein A [Candidatus Bathyarchaeota archaeon]